MPSPNQIGARSYAVWRKLPAGSHVKQYNRTQTDNRAVPARDLHPLAELADLIRNSAWGRRA